MSSGFCETIKEKYKEYKVLVYNQKTDDEIKKGLINIEKLIKGYDLFIYSPSITVGVNIDFKYFNSIYGYMCNSICARVYYQMLFRVRNIVNTNINILVDKFITINNSPYDSFDFIKGCLYDKEHVLTAFEYIMIWNKWESNNTKNFLKVFKYYTELKGFTFNLEKKDKEKIEPQTNTKEYITTLLNSDLVDKDEFLLLTNKTKKLEATTEDKFKIEKYIYFTKFELDKDFNDEVVFKEKYYKQMHILQGYLYNKFYNDKYKENNEKLIKKIHDNMEKKDDSKYKKFYDLNNVIEKIDEKYYNNSFNKNIIELKHNFFIQIEKLLKEKDGIINKDVLTKKKDDILTIINDKAFKTVYNTRTINDKDATPKKLLGSISSVFENFGVHIENKRLTTKTNKIRDEVLIITHNEAIPESYIDFDKFYNKFVEKHKIKIEKKNDLKQFIIEFF